MAIDKNVMGMSLQLNEEFITNLAKQMVSESIMETIGGGNKFVETIVGEILKTKVDPENGRVSTYSSAIPYIQWLINKVIRDEIAGTVQEILDEKRPEIRKRIKNELMKEKTINEFFDAFTECVTHSISSVWRTKIDVTFLHSKDE